MKVDQTDAIDCTSTHRTQKDPASHTEIWLTALKKKKGKKENSKQKCYMENAKAYS